MIDDGKCTLETLAKEFDPALAAQYPDVTLRHLATMTSGIDGVGGSYDADDEGRSDANALVDPQTPFFAPGTKYMYWDEATQHYGFVLTEDRRRAVGGLPETPHSGSDRNFAIRLEAGRHAQGAQLDRRHRDIGQRSGSVRAPVPEPWSLERTAIDQCQIGSTRRRACRSRRRCPTHMPRATARDLASMAIHWWPNGTTPEGKRRWPDAPRGTYSRSGHNNNDLFVIPAWNMVVVRLGLDQREDEITSGEYNVFLKMVGAAILDPVVEGERRVWHPLTVSFRGPVANEEDSEPNPFLDYRLQVIFTGPRGRQFHVPGFFDGDGHGDGKGDVWRVRFTPDEPGQWTFQASFRAGERVAISLDPQAGPRLASMASRGLFEVEAT